MADAIYRGTVHQACRRPQQVTLRAGSPAAARRAIKAMYPWSTRVTKLIKVRDLDA